MVRIKSGLQEAKMKFVVSFTFMSFVLVCSIAYCQQMNLSSFVAYQHILPMAKTFATDITLTSLEFTHDRVGQIADGKMEIHAGKTNFWLASFTSISKDSSITFYCYNDDGTITIAELSRGENIDSLPPVLPGSLDSPEALRAAYEDIAGTFIQSHSNVRIGLATLVMNTWQFRFISDTDTLVVILDSKTGTTLSYRLTPVGISSLTDATFEVTSIYPLPYNPTVNSTLTISLAVEAHGEISFELFDVPGRKTTQLYSGTVAAGLNNLTLSLPSSIPTGIHYLIIKQNGAMSTKPIMVIR